MKSDFLQILSILTCLLSFVLISVKAVCPPKPLMKVQECTEYIIPELSDSSRPQSYKDQVIRAKEKCRDLKLHDVAACIQDVLDNCRGMTDDEQTLHRLFDKDKTLKTVEYFCNHIREYERHGECISNHHNETYRCSQPARNSFVNKERAGANIDTLITGSCRFYEVARRCLTNTTKQFCGEDASIFIYTIMSGSMPPYCEVSYFPNDEAGTTNGYTSAADVTSSLSCFLFLVTLFIVMI